MLGTAKHHIFFTYSTRGLTLNKHVGHKASGDVFILKLSDTEDEHGRRFYVNLEPEDLLPEDLLDLVLRVVQDPNPECITDKWR